jgi:hypothetical protein
MVILLVSHTGRAFLNVQKHTRHTVRDRLQLRTDTFWFAFDLGQVRNVVHRVLQVESEPGAHTLIHCEIWTGADSVSAIGIEGIDKGANSQS